MRPARSSLLIDPLAWCAGVLDGCGAFIVEARGERWNWRVTLATSEVTARKFAALTGTEVRRIGNGRWSVGGANVAPLLAQSIPRMFCLHEEASVVYRYLITRSKGKRMRGPLSEAIEKYRGEMVARLAAAPAKQRGSR